MQREGVGGGEVTEGTIKGSDASYTDFRGVLLEAGQGDQLSRVGLSLNQLSRILAKPGSARVDREPWAEASLRRRLRSLSKAWPRRETLSPGKPVPHGPCFLERLLQSCPSA